MQNNRRRRRSVTARQRARPPITAAPLCAVSAGGGKPGAPMPSEELSDGIFAFVRDIVMLPFDFQTAFCFQAFDVGMAILIYVRWQGGIVMPPLGFQTASYRTVKP
nr:hypothetical protein predicted by Glimmer/Critica [Neisseria meningitidis alpha275]